MIWIEINGGPGRTRTFDLPIMLKLDLNVVCPLLLPIIMSPIINQAKILSFLILIS